MKSSVLDGKQILVVDVGDGSPFPGRHRIRRPSLGGFAQSQKLQLKIIR
jgi:hypothetical protein